MIKFNKLVYLLAVVNATIIGISFMFVKITLDYALALDTLTYRFSAAFFIMFIFVGTGVVKVKYRGKSLYKLLLLSTMYPLGFCFSQRAVEFIQKVP